MNVKSDRDAGGADNGARAILRVPEVLIDIAAQHRGCSLNELVARLGIPKASLHRILRTLERGSFLAHEAGTYTLGPNSFHLATLIGNAAPSRPFPASARPELERLAAETGETVMLGVLAHDHPEVVYVDVLDSRFPVRFTIPIGDRRLLHSVASGKAILAFLTADAQQHYLEMAEFAAFTPKTTAKHELPGILAAIRKTAVAFDDGGKALGASALASPIFNASECVLGAVSLAGPTDRMEAGRALFEAQVRDAALRISRVLGYQGEYPPV